MYGKLCKAIKARKVLNPEYRAEFNLFYLAQKLKAQLETARKVREQAPDDVKRRAATTGARSRKPEAVVLTRTNEKGMVRPVRDGEETPHVDRKTRRKERKNAMVRRRWLYTSEYGVFYVYFFS